MPLLHRVDVVVIGAGIAGISAAHHLTTLGCKDVLIVDPLPPLSLTSDKSTECYRNFWPGPDDAMTAFMARSLDLLERDGEAVRMNRRGYLFVTEKPSRFETWRTAAEQASDYGAGEVRDVSLVAEFNDGFDFHADAHRSFPFLKPGARAMHIRRAGWLKSDLLGRLWLDRALAAGASLVRGEAVAIERQAGRVSGVHLTLKGGDEARVACDSVLNAAGPLCHRVARMVGLELPVFSELHLKLNFRDRLHAMPRNAPLVINDDKVTLPWTAEERESLAADVDTRFLTEEFPSGVHGRPEGEGEAVLLLWTYHLDPVEPAWPISELPHLAESVVRGMSTVVPAFSGYFNSFDKPILDGGYYTKTKENRPLIGATLVPGFFLSCGYSGYGIMASTAGGELAARSMLGLELPAYAPALRLDRYADPGYVARLESWQDSSQL